MERPKCRLCGVLHYATEPHIWPDGRRTHNPLNPLDENPSPRTKQARLPEFVTRPVTSLPVTRPVTAKSVTPRVTPCPQCAVWEAEVRQLKRQLAEAHGGGRPGAVPPAERMRLMRAKRKDRKKAERQDFEG